MQKLFLIIILLAIAAGIGIGYTGLVPGLSSFLGADKPKDLGIKFAADLPKTIEAKTGPDIAPLADSDTPAGSLNYTGSKPLSYTISSGDLTALLNFHFWKYYPFTQVQVKINPDGSVESSGVINMQTALSAIEGHGFNTGEVKRAMQDYHIPAISLPFYLKFKGGVNNDEISLNIETAQAGKISLPAPVISANTGRLISALQSLAHSISGFSVKKLSFDNGTMTFDGTIPEKESAVGQ
jgi:hypothetical protein